MFISKKLNFIRQFTASEIPFSMIFRKDVRFPHAVGVVVAESAKIGSGVCVWSNVTIGGKENGKETFYPVIEDDVQIMSGAKIIGNVRIGKGAVIGAGALILKDVPAGAVVVSKNEQIILTNNLK